MKTPKVKSAGQIFLIPQENIAPNPNQPRQRFDYDELEGLAQSIRQNGILQPITVRQTETGFELISGERRLRAARLVGLTKIPAIVAELDNKNSAVFSLIENLQRQDLDCFEEAEAIDRLVTDYGMSREELSRKLGKAPSTLSNKLRLLRLPEDMRYRLTRGGLSERHARALLQLDNDEQRARALGIMLDRHLTVQESERLVEQMLAKTGKNRTNFRGVRDVRVFINTLNHAVDAIRRAGVDADAAKSETPEYIEYIVRIPKLEQLKLPLSAEDEAV
ncbi:MAG TPA: ParB/RepB/Spo0J family partition protein [Candidatus Fimenecus stercoravium]|nr:ParB/RepB/Spo0J family partition protein [Candidatus Fimenecus stercoravium]